MAMANDGESQGESSPFDALLKEMPRIADAVKEFPEQVQAQAFEALMEEARRRIGSESSRPASPRRTTRRSAPRRSPSTASGQKAPRKRTGGPTTIRDLDLAPKGKTSLREFVGEKQPKTNHDQNVLSVYYLSEILGVPAVTLDHVFTCYRDIRWREPASLSNSLSLTSNRKRFLDTSNLEDIKLTPAGRSHVELDLPPTTKKG
jgi:hypothetical protein